MQPDECMYICDQFTEYHENTLTKEIRAQIDTHLSLCKACKKTFDDLAGLIQTLHHLPALTSSPDFTSDLMDKIHASQSEPAWHRIVYSSYSRVAGYAIAAGLLVALGLNIWLDPVASKSLSDKPQFAAEKVTQSIESQAVVALDDSAMGKAADSLEIQQTIQSGNRSLQLVNSSK